MALLSCRRHLHPVASASAVPQPPPPPSPTSLPLLSPPLRHSVCLRPLRRRPTPLPLPPPPLQPPQPRPMRAAYHPRHHHRHPSLCLESRRGSGSGTGIAARAALPAARASDVRVTCAACDFLGMSARAAVVPSPPAPQPPWSLRHPTTLRPWSLHLCLHSRLHSLFASSCQPRRTPPSLVAVTSTSFAANALARPAPIHTPI